METITEPPVIQRQTPASELRVTSLRREITGAAQIGRTRRVELVVRKRHLAPRNVDQPLEAGLRE